MSSSALVLVLVAAVLHAGWNFAAKRVRYGGVAFVWAYSVVSLVVLVPAVVVALVVEPAEPRWTWLWAAYSVTTLDVPPVVYFGLGAFLQSVMLTPQVLGNRSRVRHLWQQHRWEVMIVAFLSPLAYVLVLFAMRLAPVSLVAPAREVSIVLSGLAAWLVLGEANATRRLVGSVVVLGGIVAIALA